MRNINPPTLFPQIESYYLPHPLLSPYNALGLSLVNLPVESSKLRQIACKRPLCRNAISG